MDRAHERLARIGDFPATYLPPPYDMFDSSDPEFFPQLRQEHKAELAHKLCKFINIRQS